MMRRMLNRLGLLGRGPRAAGASVFKPGARPVARRSSPRT
jgi:hypothetical protein